MSILSKTGWFYVFMIVTLMGSVAGGITALVMGNDTIAGVLFGYVGGGAVSMLSQLGGVKAGLPIIVGAALMASLTGCGPIGQYDPQCAIDVAQECVEKMQDCKEEVEETDDETE
jgi:hypothetical protein